MCKPGVEENSAGGQETESGMRSVETVFIQPFVNNFRKFLRNRAKMNLPAASGGVLNPTANKMLNILFLLLTQ
jgi:hypothetical protein